MLLFPFGNAFPLQSAKAQCQPEWVEGFGVPGMDELVYELTAFDDGDGSALYAGGDFTTAGSVSANYIAKWNGASWSALGSGMNNIVRALVVFDDGSGPGLYVGGFFTTAGGVNANFIAKWNGASWSALGSGMNNAVWSLAVFDDGGGPSLYAGGYFTTAGGVSANHIAKWNGISWSALASGLDEYVFDLEVFDDGGGPTLYAAGLVDLPLTGIAKWNGASWSSLGVVNGFSVGDLTVFDDGGGPALYAGGQFGEIDGIIANGIAKWDGVVWSALGSGVEDSVGAPTVAVATLTVFDDGGGPALYAGGFFTIAGGVSANRIAKWNGAGWSALGSGMNSQVYALVDFDEGGGPALYAGGHFTTAGGTLSSMIAKWACHPRFVDGNASGLNNGKSWVNAFTSLQSALASADSGDEIWVAKGTYKPATCPTPPCSFNSSSPERSATFQLESGVALYGGFAGGESSRDLRDPVNNVTILSGDLNGNDTPVACTQNSPDCDSFGGLCVDGFCIIRNANGENSYHVITGSGVSTTAVLDGFRITAGNANSSPNIVGGGGNISGSPTIANCIFSENAAALQGGGMRNFASHSTMTNCEFIRNWALYGGGMYNSSSDVNMQNCTFSYNSSSVQGAGLFSGFGSTLTMSNSIFRRNSAESDGGGIYNSSSDLTVTNSLFSENSAGGAGGGVNNQTNTANVVGCTFNGNSASVGGAMLNRGDITVTNCTFSGNFSGGGAVFNYDDQQVYTNCTFSGNSTNGNGGGVYNFLASSPTITNCIFWNNVDDVDGDVGGPFMDESAQIYTESGAPTVDFSLVHGGWTGVGSNNLNADPLFFDSDGADNIVGTIDDDLRLRAGSPAIDAGNTLALPLDSFDLDGDGNTTERISHDVGGNPRILDDPLTFPDTGVPGSNVVDMGAFEYFSDCNGGGIPDVCDLDCGAADGPCDIPGCGDSFDCDGNGILDACDIADCGGSPACDDCNANGVPDECDIALATSLDVNPADGVPDECDGFISTCAPPQDDNWSCPGNWFVLPPGTYPNDADPVNGTAGVFVELDATDNVVLDVDVTIPGLRMFTGATLNVTGGNLTITGAEAQTAGITLPPRVKLRLDGAIVVANGYDVTVQSGAVAVNNGGVYHSMGATDSALRTVDITVYAGGELSFEHTMSMTSSGTVLLDGSETDPFCPQPSMVAGNVAGITLPPKIRVRNSAYANIVGICSMAGAVDVLVDSTRPVELGGDFDNRSVVPSLFDWTAGKLTLNGATAQTFEVAGINLGQTMDGFSTNSDALFDNCPPAQQHANFSMGTVEVASTANVTFANHFANTAGVGCAEALYVHNLTFQSGATVTIDNCKVYYDTLTDNGVTPTLIGCGELLSTTRPDTPNPDPSSIKKNRGLALSIPGPNTAGAGSLTALRVSLMELQNPVPSNLPQSPPQDFSAYEFGATCTDPGGCVRWIGEPKVFLESQDSPGSGNFMAARLQCTPLYRDWTTAGSFYVVGAEITPSSKYDVQQFAQTCAGLESSCTAVSLPLRITTARHGDLAAPYNPPATSTQPDALDITQLVNKLKNVPGAPVKAIAQLQPNLPELNANVNALDIVAVVDAVKQKAYGFSGPCPCPSTVTCGSTACSTVTPCVTAFGAGATCVKTCTGGDNAGAPCINDTHGHCPGGTCGPGFCRDRCGRCN